MGDRLQVCWKIYLTPPHPTSELCPITDGTSEFDSACNRGDHIISGLHPTLTTLPVPCEPITQTRLPSPVPADLRARLSYLPAIIQPPPYSNPTKGMRAQGWLLPDVPWDHSLKEALFHSGKTYWLREGPVSLGPQQGVPRVRWETRPEFSGQPGHDRGGGTARV